MSNLAENWEVFTEREILTMHAAWCYRKKLKGEKPPEVGLLPFLPRKQMRFMLLDYGRIWHRPVNDLVKKLKV